MGTSASELEGRHALVTGATSGIGLGIAMALARHGCRLSFSGLGEAEDIAELTQDLVEAGAPEADHVPADLLDVAQIEAMVTAAQRARGAIDILVNNAGIQFVSPVQDFPVDRWDAIIAINLSAVFHTIRCALPGMIDAGHGRVINIASAHALRASPYKAAYVAAKHGVAGLTKTVALEVAEQGITVNAIAPGYVDTPLVRGQVADTAKARGISEDDVVRDVMLVAQPTRRLISVDEVASMVAWLAGDGAASVTGTVLPMDGGWTAR
ncbi:3-hydroxybutyrate dehydrogenase [Marinihelvus fidelis]|uniref:3-hydroxybutyrate dehydrogenase n=1 Tax=Marinihelvus fidelis TaxID=2613842 RepID=A0A5N0TCJ9_9GAMM|nr:3-hydroxybutyrate dehydrogenase [Marinihelvus fidelis]KAA9132762.1 3-hydroxybutyrate dehydrogenase [Marinihelvus fidelis]